MDPLVKSSTRFISNKDELESYTCDRLHIDEFHLFQKELKLLKSKLKAKDDTIANLRNELKFYKELVLSLPIESNFDSRHSNSYSSIKYLSKWPKGGSEKQFLHSLSKSKMPVISYYNKDELLLEHKLFADDYHIQKLKGRNYHLNRQYSNQSKIYRINIFKII